MNNKKTKKEYNRYKLNTILNNLDVVRQLKARGASNSQIAKHFNIGNTTFYKYLNESEELREALNTGIVDLVNDLTNELVRKALPHTLTTTKTIEKNGTITTEVIEKEVDGELGSLIFLLKNLAPDRFTNDPSTLDIKRKELELKQQQAENSF